GALPLELLDGRSDQGRLPGPRLADEQRQPAPAAQAVLQVAQGLAMLAGEQEKPRIRCQVERPFPQSEECFVHYRIQSVRASNFQTMATAHNNTTSAPEDATISRRLFRLTRSNVVVIVGTSATTGKASATSTSSSLRKLVSRYSRRAPKPRPTPSPRQAPRRLMSSRFGLMGRCGNRAVSMILNCSPICRRSRFAATFASWLLASRLWYVV